MGKIISAYFLSSVGRRSSKNRKTYETCNVEVDITGKKYENIELFPTATRSTCI